MHFTNLDSLLLLLTTLQFATGVFCRSYRDGTPIDATKLTTNAARMRAGFPPLKPRNMNIPSRVQGHGHGHHHGDDGRARYPKPSMVYPNPVTGCIQVHRANDSNLEGYVKKSCSATNYLGHTRDYDSRMAVTFTPVNPCNIEINNHKGSYKYLGFAGNDLGSNLAHYMVVTNPTSPGSRPSSVGHTRKSTTPNSESAIWSYDSQSRRLTPKWINSDGSSISPYLWYYPSTGAHAIVAHQTEHPSDSYEVYYTVD